MLILHLFHYIGFTGAQIFNAFLVLLILKRAGKLFGAYRHVMLVFTFCSMLYSGVEIVTQPVLHMKGPMFVVYLDGTAFPESLGSFIACLHCGTFGFLISVLAAQFFYRYVALCRSNLLRFLDGNRIFLIFLPCIFIYASWFQLVRWGMSATIEKRFYLKFVREKVRSTEHSELFRDDLGGADSMTASFIAPLYWQIGENGEKIWRFPDVTSAMICTFIIMTLSSLIFFFALKIFFHMKSEKDHMSRTTLELNRQLFIMLTAQTIVPVVTMYIPVGLFIALPFFNIGLGSFVNYPSASMALYPCIEPLIAIYCIKDFRMVVIKLLPRCKTRVTETVRSVYSSKTVVQ
ncbi:hypothetical protein CRE_11221 [Caenorhabditis remanei]|uniref:Serpentine receptor class r-10 n=1 Tax=Caenorhabditis remanei TaxID=31234 RepID=E3MQF2_CAERE|nr:hypothetical protein CRE_11221 [Caenorhabditis remanei]